MLSKMRTGFRTKFANSCKMAFFKYKLRLQANRRWRIKTEHKTISASKQTFDVVRRDEDDDDRELIKFWG